VIPSEVRVSEPTTTVDPVAYLRATSPFATLRRELFDEAVRDVEVVFEPAGKQLVRVGGAPLEHLWVIRKGAVRLERDGQTLQLLEEGEMFGYTSLVSGEATLDVVVEEDLVAYRLPGAAFRALLGDASFAGHFAAGLAERLRASLEQSPVATFRADVSGAVEQLVKRPPLWVEETSTVRDAARVMREASISSVLVRGEPAGIVTDRDFRNRVLADDLGPDTSLTRIVSRPLRTVTVGTPIYEAWRTLLDAGVHHLPVLRGDEIVGVVTAGDLLKHSASGPVAVLRSVERLPSRDSLPGYARKVAEMTSVLLAGGLEASTISGFVARLNDALVHRILRWAEADLGAAPAPWAWIAFGSEGRMEQTLLTDQDNALVYADEGEGAREWYAALAARVNEDLVAAGFPECPGGYMAKRWHGPLSEWTRRFRGWIDAPAPQALLEASIFFDFRRVAGTLGLDPLDAALTEAAGRPVFLRFLAKAALDFRPPPLLLLRLKGTSSVVDLKAHGISPIVFLARCYGLEAGLRARGTLERIDGAQRAGKVDEEVATRVAEAYRYLIGLRLRLQLRRIAAGEVVTNQVALAELTPLERTRLKDALRAVKSWQDAGAFHFKTEF
jgi:CBS domain-containing protein